MSGYLTRLLLRVFLSIVLLIKLLCNESSSESGDLSGGGEAILGNSCLSAEFGFREFDPSLKVSVISLSPIP
uniref:Putative secreted protein n=1 Tax=Panstrongylus lignarius TaxID=156445 RepID=A0A224XU80_9HEMI